MTYFTTVDSPIGELLLTSEGGGLTRLHMGGTAPSGWTRAPEQFIDVTTQLEHYWSGSLTSFEVPLAATGTPFQLDVWAALREIPYGETISYGELARSIGKPRAVRAVGRANGANPIAIIVPCHRVIGSNGTLTGYGGGLDRKATLLAHEGVTLGVPSI